MFLRVSLLAGILSRGFALDPCSNYIELPRAEYRGALCPYNSEKQTCDVTLSPGWYRAVGRNGDLRMQESPVELFACGTKFPIWMNGSHPTIVEDEVDVTLLQAVTDQTTTAKVKNCNDEYFVYYLEPTGACPQAYCFGITEEDPCPPLDPCDMYEHELVDYDEVRSFTCNVNPPEDCDGVEYSMTWAAFSNAGTGFLNVTQSPPNGTCGFNYAMWIKETPAADVEGISTNVVCSKAGDEPCAVEVTLRSKICKWYTVFEAPLSGTCSGYCLDDPTASCPTQQTTTESPTSSETTDEDPCFSNCSGQVDYLWLIIVIVLVLIAICVVAVAVMLYKTRKPGQILLSSLQPSVKDEDKDGIKNLESKPDMKAKWMIVNNSVGPVDTISGSGYPVVKSNLDDGVE